MQQKGATRGKKHTATVSPHPAIPDKLYFRIGEAARLLSLPPYVLRFWETEFPQLRPNKGGTGQRLYRRRDVEMALRIKQLLYEEGYTIPGARQLLKSEQRDSSQTGEVSTEAAISGASPDRIEEEPALGRLRRIRAELKEISLFLEQPGSGDLPLHIPHKTRRGLHLASRRNSPADSTPTLFSSEE